MFKYAFNQPHVAFILSAVGFVGCLLLNAYVPFVGLNLLALSLVIVLFSGFDVLGYYYLVGESNMDKQRLVSYRVLQVVFQHLLTVVLLCTFGWKIALLYNVAWWFGVCDVLYYILLGQKFMHWDSMYWLWWTPYGVIVGRGNIAGAGVALQAMIGIVVAVVLYCYL